ncbi:MAG: hypothetical protein OZSIB_1632 [Candidatus Ozemobacter sibiricus]|jgi:uncharacterized protein (DUF697 family)|uniref:EcsC family protein n=1 Tax=Candidatus Ozemobacter sibiricus TaxID=2268124 RepID=A0A367ZJG1_9BACT|nr:MAG: hypothetical protein OZSIB_1632 [Candidatus Ozemobacter sibiricus]
MAALDESMISKALAWAYESALAPGGRGIESAYDLAREYGAGEGSLASKVDAFIRWQKAKAGMAGFVAGLGGLLTLPVAVPANIASVLFIQVRMIAAIAIMCGHDPREDRVKTLIFACLCGSEAKEILKHAGIQLGKKVAEQAIRRLSVEMIKQINKMVGFRLVTKFGQTGLVNLGKAIPFLGGIISGTVDLLATDAIGAVAKASFLDEPSEDQRSEDSPESESPEAPENPEDPGSSAP